MKMMIKPIMMLVLLAVGSTASAQKLKDLLYSGKLKSDAGTVIRKTDDLSTKIDTTEKKAQAPVVDMAAPNAVPPVAAVPATPATQVAAANKTADSTTLTATTTPATTVAVEGGVDSVAVAAAPATPATPAAPKSNNRVWKEFTDSLMKDLRTEIQSNKKIKKEMYYVTVDYEIDLDGTTSVSNVTASPENAMLQALVKDRMMSTPPKVQPVPRKVKRKYNFTVTKD